MSRDAILHKVRTALGRNVGAPPPEPPPIPERRFAAGVESFRACLDKLGGTTRVTASPEEARSAVRQILQGRPALAANHPFLTTCGVGGLENVRKGVDDPGAWRTACAEVDVGITSADYALARTGTLVMIAGPENPRLVSLLPPIHIAVVPLSRLIGSLDELLAREPRVFERSASMVLITGPSRTADIEQILVRGVHGPGELHVVFVAG